MSYKELRISLAPGQDAELASEALLEADSMGTAIKDKGDLEMTGQWYGDLITDHLKAGYQETPVVTGYFDGDLADEAVIEAVSQAFSRYGLDFGAASYQLKPLEDHDWQEEWKKYYHALPVSSQLEIVPVWEKAGAEEGGRKAIYLDPGMAFGTGQHPTTQLALQLMEGWMRGGEKLLDVGTGSGILAIAGRVLGAETVKAYEYDASLIDTAKYNLSLNPGMEDISVQANDKLNGIEGEEADLITANILANILIPLIPQAYANLKDQGGFILSGIFEDQFDKVMDALKAADFYVVEYRRRGGWYGIYARKGREFMEKDCL